MATRNVQNETAGTAPQAPALPAKDERLIQASLLTRTLRRPEFGAFLGLLVVFAFFSIVADGFFEVSGAARFLDRAAPIGIVAVAVSLLMIGGEFDLSAGVMTGATGLMAGLIATELDVNLWLGILAGLAFAVLVGFVNGLMVMKTALPSFIVTLATFFVVRGGNLGLTKNLTDTVKVSGIDDVPGYDSARVVFASSWGTPPSDFRITVLWWAIFTAVATWVLLRTKVGNWIFSVGGDPNAARNVGVPVRATKIGLFITTAVAAWFVGVTNAVRFTSVEAGQGIGEEFMYIIAAVVGGTLLTGGYGSAVGATIGALIMGMAFVGIAFAGWDTDWRWLFVGVLLLIAVLVNRYVRRKAEEARR
jgi:simple sugar transport system permease protein